MACESKIDVVGLGDADVDIYFEVNYLPRWDEKIRADQLAFYPGGMVANFLAVLRSLGTPCGFHGPLGNDEFGKLALGNLIARGVDTRGVIMREGGRTYFCVVFLDDSGEKALVVAPTDCMYPEPNELSETLFAEASHLHTTADNISTLKRATALAQQHNVTISIDVEPSATKQFEQLRPLLSSLDIVFIKKETLLRLTQKAQLEKAISHLLTRGVSVVCVTMGAGGALVANGTETVLVPAFSVLVVDSTGAGDAFAAGFVHAFLQKWPLADAARFASAVAAIIIGHRGGNAAAPSREEVFAFLKHHGATLELWQ